MKINYLLELPSILDFLLLAVHVFIIVSVMRLETQPRWQKEWAAGSIKTSEHYSTYSHATQRWTHSYLRHFTQTLTLAVGDPVAHIAAEALQPPRAERWRHRNPVIPAVSELTPFGHMA